MKKIIKYFWRDVIFISLVIYIFVNSSNIYILSVSSIIALVHIIVSIVSYLRDESIIKNQDHP
jgi:hypothetical protein